MDFESPPQRINVSRVAVSSEFEEKCYRKFGPKARKLDVIGDNAKMLQVLILVSELAQLNLQGVFTVFCGTRLAVNLQDWLIKFAL